MTALPSPLPEGEVTHAVRRVRVYGLSQLGASELYPDRSLNPHPELRSDLSLRER